MHSAHTMHSFYRLTAAALLAATPALVPASASAAEPAPLTPPPAPVTALPATAADEAAIRSVGARYMDGMAKRDATLVATCIDPEDRAEIHSLIPPIMAEAAQLQSAQTREMVANFYADIPPADRAKPSEMQATAGFFNFVLLGSPAMAEAMKSAVFQVTKVTVAPDGQEATLTYTMDFNNQSVTTRERLRRTQGQWYLRTSMRPSRVAEALRNSLRTHSKNNP